MNKRLYWGLLALIILLGTAFVFIMLHDRAEIRKLEEELANIKEQEQHVPQQADAGNKPPREASAGHKWEWHGDHWHEMPIAQDIPGTQTHEGPLTYHEELLETNPLKALVLQSEERGHWSAKWIAEFPPDDLEAQEFARMTYLRKYYIQTYGDLLETPEYEKEAREFKKASAIYNHMYDTIRSYSYGARRCDLMKLTWLSLDSDPVTGGGRHPSEYFGDPETRDQLKRLGMWDY